MEQDKLPERRDIENLVRYLDIFYQPGFKAAEWSGGGFDDEGVYHGNYPDYHPKVVEFYDILYQDCWFNKKYLSDPVLEKINQPELIAGASLSEIRSLLTWCLRTERFCDGHWQSVIESGLIKSILENLRKLL